MPETYSDRLGRIGEADFQQLMSRTGAVVNKSRDDRAGWDFLVELPDPCSGGRILEGFAETLSGVEDRVEHMRFVVQVKARRTRTPRAIEMSNWARLVTTPYPSFFLVLDYDEDDCCQRASLAHVSDELREAFFRRLRQDYLDKKVTGLHERTLVLPEAALVEVLPWSGKNLLVFMETAAGQSPSLYSKAKLEFNEKVGYEEGSYSLRGKIIFAAPGGEEDAKQQIRDILLGRRQDAFFDIEEGLEAIDHRFGTEVVVGKTSSPGMMKPAAFSTAEVRLTSSSGASFMTAIGDLHTTHGWEKLLGDPGPICAIQSLFLELVFPFGDGPPDVKVKPIDPARRYTLGEMSLWISLMRAMCGASKERPVQVSVFVHPPLGFLSKTGPVLPPPLSGWMFGFSGGDEEFLAVARTASVVWALASAARVNPNLVSATGDEWMTQVDNLKLLSALLSSQEGRVRDFDSEGSLVACPLEAVEGAWIEVPRQIFLQIGDAIFVAEVWVCGTAWSGLLRISEIALSAVHYVKQDDKAREYLAGETSETVSLRPKQGLPPQ